MAGVVALPLIAPAGVELVDLAGHITELLQIEGLVHLDGCHG
jgi:hypothetical protein